MPRTLIKLDSGIIHTLEFSEHLRILHAQEACIHRDEVLSVDYIRCGSGPQEGSEWLQLAWVPIQYAAPAPLHLIGEVKLYIHRQSLRGLRGRCLHAENGRVTVLT